MKTSLSAGMAACCLIAGGLPAYGGSFSANYNDGLLPAGTHIFGTDPVLSGRIEPTGGVGNSGSVKLTDASGGLNASYIIDDLDGGQGINGFTATFKLRIGGTDTAADGASFSVGNDIADGVFAVGEDGAGSGLRISFDSYVNGEAGETAPAFDLRWNNVQVASIPVPSVPGASLNTNTFADVMVRLNPTGSLDMTWNGTPVFTNYFFGYQPIEGARYAWGARTGGAMSNHYLDDINIVTSTGDLTPAVLRSPISIRVMNGYGGLFNVVDNGAAGTTYQWQRKAPGGASFADIAGAQGNVYQTPALTLADAGAAYRVVLENAKGSATSGEAVIDVVNLPLGAPTVAYDFNNGNLPAGTAAYANATVLADGGEGNSAHMQLTEAVNDQRGVWTVPDLNGGSPVESIEVAYKLRMSNGTNPPADGFGFHWAPNLPWTPELPVASYPLSEEPIGAGLSVCFDVYDNTDGNPNTPGGEAPAIDVFWLGARVGGAIVPVEFLNTGGAFQDVIIKLSAAGKIDVMFNGIVLVYQLQVPSWTAFAGASYGFSARTGGLNQIHAIDNVAIRSVAYAGPITVVSPPQNVTTVPGRTATFSVTTSDPAMTQYQWQVKGPGAPAFTNIPSANGQTYTTPTLVAGDSGTEYRAHLTSTRNGTSADSAAAVLTVLNVTRPAAPQINDTFDDGAGPTNTGSAAATGQTISGQAAYFIDGGTNGSGSLRLTEYIASQFGTLVVDDFNSGASVGSFTVAVNAQIFGAGPADGWSLSWSDAIAPGQAYANFETGIGDDLRVGFVTYGPSGVGVVVFWQGVQLTKVLVPIELLQTAQGSYEEVLFRLTQNPGALGAKLDVVQDGVVIINNLDIPGFAGVTNGRFALGARTGGAFEEHRYDDLAIRTEAYTGPIVFTTQTPATRTVADGQPTTLFVRTNDPQRTTFQWQVRPAGGGAFANVTDGTGANTDTYTTAPLSIAQTGITYRCLCTSPVNSITSTETVVTVVNPNYPVTFERIIDFNDLGNPLPAEGQVLGSAVHVPNGGIGDTGKMQLTSNVNGLTGSFVLTDLDAGAPVTSFVTSYRMRIGDATTPPADGASFIWSPTLPAAAFGEDGAGNGLIVSFDTYNNVDGNPNSLTGEAPAIEARWNGLSLGNVRVPLSLLQTDLVFAEVLVRVNADGTLDVVVDGFIAFWRTPLPNFTPVSGGVFGWGARTGGLNAAHEIDDIRITTTAAGGTQPPVDVALSGGNLVITYTGVLQAATINNGAITGWTDVPGATSPYSVSTAGAASKLYRVRP